ncbi:hypothetical protein P3T23_008754 [Paraburkholderia sp. GAS448]
MLLGWGTFLPLSVRFTWTAGFGLVCTFAAPHYQ